MKKRMKELGRSFLDLFSMTGPLDKPTKAATALIEKVPEKKACEKDPALRMEKKAATFKFSLDMLEEIRFSAHHNRMTKSAVVEAALREYFRK